MTDEARSRHLRIALFALLVTGLVGFGLFGSVTVGAGLHAGARQRVAAILLAADAAMAATGIPAAWRGVMWLAGGVSLAATLWLIWRAAGPGDDHE